MKSLLFVLIFISSLLAANATEYSCSCVDEVLSLNTGKVSSHAEHKSESSDKDHRDHCEHTCGQCHFAAVLSSHFTFVSKSSLVSSDFFEIKRQPLKISLSLYRPPIA